MMGVYIKGVEMPKDGEHPYWVTIHSDGTVEYNENKGQGWQTSEAVPVPQHGRLIEKHDVFKLISAFPEIDKLLTVEFMTALYNLPTIIPGEEATQKEGGQDE